MGLRKLGKIQEHANSVSSIKLGLWWKVSLGFITPIILGYQMYKLFELNLLKQFDTEMVTMKVMRMPLFYTVAGS